MRMFFENFRRRYLHKISNDEIKIFDLISERIRDEYRSIIRAQVESIQSSHDGDDGKTIYYKVDISRLRKSIGDNFKLPTGDGIGLVAGIVISLNEVAQPFECAAQDGVIYYLRILDCADDPVSEPEFSVFSFSDHLQ